MTKTEFDAKDFEKLFDGFVRTWRGGARLDELLVRGTTEGAKCADYFFQQQVVGCVLARTIPSTARNGA